MDKIKQANLIALYRCRVCLEDVERLYPLEGPIANCDVDIATMITYCTSVEIDLNDELPNGVCVPCFRTIRIAYNFIVQFRENNLKLLKEKSSLEPISDEYVYEDSEYNTQVDNIQATNTETELYEYEVLDSDEETKQFVKKTDGHLDQVIKYELQDDQEPTEEQQLIEYDQQEVDVETMDFLVDSLETLPDTSTNFQNVTVKVIKKSPLPETQQPQTVLRRKIKIQFSCPVCPKAYFVNFESGLVPHMTLHPGEFPCNICPDDTLYNSDSFLNHFMQCHRYQCPYCLKSYHKAGTLGAHIKLHYKFRFHCSHEGCTKSFPTQWSLKKHEAVHSNSCAYSCAECNMQFKTYDTYMYHQKKHGGRKFLCMCCGRTFLQSVHLKYHMQQHTGIKQFRCDLCVKSYTSSTQLKKHKKRHHPNQTETNEAKPYVVNIV